MERYIITLDEHGTLHVPDVSATAIWMNEPELMELFGVVALTLRAAIKAVYKSGILNPGEGLNLSTEGLQANIRPQYNSFAPRIRLEWHNKAAHHERIISRDAPLSYIPTGGRVICKCFLQIPERVVHFSMRTRLLPPPTFFPCPSQVPIRNASR